MIDYLERDWTRERGSNMCFRPPSFDEMMKKCDACGAFNAPELTKCKKCGADLPTGGAAAAAPGAPAATGAPAAPGAPKPPAA